MNSSEPRRAMRRGRRDRDAVGGSEGGRLRRGWREPLDGGRGRAARAAEHAARDHDRERDRGGDEAAAAERGDARPRAQRSRQATAWTGETHRDLAVESLAERGFHPRGPCAHRVDERSQLEVLLADVLVGEDPVERIELRPRRRRHLIA